ncbi:YceI family protein, partial [Klebsiella pneumoniae]
MFSISPVFFWANIYVPADFEDYCVNTLKKTALLSVLALYIPVSQAAAKEYSLDPQHTSVVISWNHFGFSNPTAYISDVSGKLAFDKENPEKSS